MKKCQKALLTLIPSFFALALAIPVASVFAPAQDNGAGEDTAIYDTSLEHAKYEKPDISRADEEEEDPEIEVNEVTLHYFNENADCKGRAFYLWVNGVDGIEYSDDLTYEQNVPQIVTYSDDGTMMTIHLDFENDERFEAFKNRSGLWFIIKFKRQGTNLNWGGQSDDMFLRYEDFPPKVEGSKHVEVWTMPAAGGGISILDMEEKTRVPGIKLAKFSSWKTIDCTVSPETNKLWWKLYAFDETYYKIKPKKREAAKKNYIVKEADNVTVPSNHKLTITFKYEAHPNIVYSLESHDPATDSITGMDVLNKVATVGFDTLYDSAKFHTYYEEANSSVKDFGITYTPTSTTFKVWSPVSANLTVMVYDSDTTAEYGGDDSYKGYHMHYTKGGIWELTIDGDLKGKYYNYQVDNTIGTNVCMDPYATSAGANGVRGLIYDINASDVKPEGWDALPTKWDGETTKGLDIATPQELSIYEVHVQDFTYDESWGGTPENAATYNGFVEKGTKVPGSSVSTGYDHLNELGVKAVQLVPMFDHDNNEVAEEIGAEKKFNWGYNPLNYNVVEGGYSSNPHDGFARVKEFRNLVLEMSKTDVHTRVIMDVVYNHVSSATGSAFHKLMPRYYFRYAAFDYDFWYDDNYAGGKKPAESVWVYEGELFDGSGCHNEVATERRMMRKYIIDSLVHWAKDYKVKGFRFDLMGLIDYQTLNAAKEALYAVDPDIYLYGEGWTSGGYHGEGSKYWLDSHPTDVATTNFGADTWNVYHNTNNFKTPSASASCYLGGFNDHFRNSIRGDNNSGGYPGSGLVQRTNAWIHPQDGEAYLASWEVANTMWGINNAQDGYYPEQTVNYASCHDNFTLRDQLYNTMHDGSPATAQDIVRTSIQVHALTMASNCAAFIQGGEELFRTKELSAADVANIGKTVNQNDVVELHGHKISHNSYNLSFECNSFKWGNKIKLTVDGTEAENSVYHYNEKFQELVKMHNKITFKRGVNVESSTDKYADFCHQPTAGKYVVNATWGGKDLEGGFAVQTNTTIIYCSVNTTDANVWVDAKNRAENGAWDLLFQYGAGEDEVEFYQEYSEGQPAGRTMLFKVCNAIRVYDTKGDTND